LKDKAKTAEWIAKELPKDDDPFGLRAEEWVRLEDARQEIQKREIMIQGLKVQRKFREEKLAEARQQVEWHQEHLDDPKSPFEIFHNYKKLIEELRGILEPKQQ